jgi:hypothetical protein
MKNPFIIILIFLTLFVSCNDQLSIPVDFSFTATAENSTVNGDTLIVDKAVPVTFTFDGNAEFITFYSGETGHEFDKRELTQTPVGDVDSCYLTFTNKPQFGNIPGTLNFYLSTSYEGLKMTDKKADSLAVLTHNWINLSDSCNLSVTNNTTNTSKVSLKSYVSSRITLAIRYKTTDNSAIQPTWQIGNLKIVVRDKKGAVTTLSANDLGFSALDLFAITNPYSTAGGTGIWDLSGVAATSPLIKIIFSGAGQPLNDDWLVSTPKLATTRIPDTGVAVKSIATTVKTYQYAFNKPGVYKVGFHAMNDNYEYRSETGMTRIIKVK